MSDTTLQPYPGPIDSAAAYFQVLAWYARHGHILRFCQHDSIPEIIVLWSSEITRLSFVGESPQECLRQLHEWVAYRHECIEEDDE